MLRFLPIIIASSAAMLASCESHIPDLRLVAPSESIDSGIISEFSNLLDEGYTVGISLTEYSLAEEAALDMLVSGSADLALVSNNLPYREDVATVMPLYPTVLHIAYRYGLDATSAESLLRGAAVYAGPEGSASRLVFERIVARQGLDADDYAYVSEAGPEPDVIIVFAPISPERTEAFPYLTRSRRGRLYRLRARPSRSSPLFTAGHPSNPLPSIGFPLFALYG